MKTLLLVVTHGLMLLVGFAAGIYALPILIAPASPSAADVQAMTASARFTGTFRRDLEDSDALHWGEGVLSVASDRIGLTGEIAPGPDYRLYLSPEFVETEADFKRLKSSMVQVGEVKTFRNFIVAVPQGVDIAAYNTAIVWCESFGQFITAAQYRNEVQDAGQSERRE